MLRLPKDFTQFALFRKFFRTEAGEERTYFTLTLLTGFVTAIMAVMLDKAIRFLTSYFGTNATFTLKAFIFGLVATFISGWITTRKYPSTAGSGIPGARVALAVFNGKLPFFSSIAKFFVSLFSLAAGFSLGREGPTVAIGASIGSNIGSFFHMSKKRVKSLLAIGAASGLAAAFNTPIAAVVFTLEEVVGDLNARMLGSIVIAAVVASVTSQVLQGHTSAYPEIHYAIRDYREMFFFIGVGIMASVMGVLWVKAVLFYRKFSLNVLHGHKLGLIMLTFLCMGALSFIEPKALGMGHSSIEELLLSLIYDWRVLIVLFSFKFLASVLCYGSGISGGLFMPILLMGASLGGLLGAGAQLNYGDLAPHTGAMAIIGMGSFFAAVTRSPFTSIMMVFELTRDYNIIIPLMVSNIVSFGLASRIHKGSVYENISEQDGIH
ncbi:MAG: chloride channel protein, partial [Bdellovibrionota bacterium]